MLTDVYKAQKAQEQRFCGNSSVVERHLAKVDVAGPTPVSRSSWKAIRNVRSCKEDVPNRLFFNSEENIDGSRHEFSTEYPTHKRGSKVVVSKEISRKDHSQVQLTATVSNADVRSEYEDLLAYYAKNIQLPGFRKGKAPKDVVERKLGEGLKADALGRILEKALHELFDAEDFPAQDKPLAYSSPELMEEPILDLQKDLTFSVTYDVFPEVSVGTWKGVEIESPVVEVSDEDINRELEQLRERNAIVMDKAENTAVAKGDVVTINYAELNTDQTIMPGSERQDFVFTVGTGANIYKIDDDIIGLKKGETKIITKAYPGDFEDPDLAGQTKTISVTVTAVKEKNLPALDDEFAQDVNEKYKTLADLKADLKKNLEKNLEQRLKELKVNDILEKALATTSIDLPESMIRLEQESRWRNLARQFNSNEDQLLSIIQSMGKTYEDMLAEWRPDVEKALKSRLIVDTLIKELGITASDEELDMEMKTMAENMNTSLEEVKQYYEQGQMLEYLREDIKERKLFDILISEAKVKKGKKQKYLDLMGNNR